jgi:hypothetical protein
LSSEFCSYSIIYCFVSFFWCAEENLQLAGVRRNSGGVRCDRRNLYFIVQLIRIHHVKQRYLLLQQIQRRFVRVQVTVIHFILENQNVIFNGWTVMNFRHVVLPKEMVKQVPKHKLMTEAEWRGIGVQQSPGWEHYMLHEPGKKLESSINCQCHKNPKLMRATFCLVSEPHILLFRRPLNYGQPTGTTSAVVNNQITAK